MCLSACGFLAHAMLLASKGQLFPDGRCHNWNAPAEGIRPLLGSLARVEKRGPCSSCVIPLRSSDFILACVRPTPAPASPAAGRHRPERWVVPGHTPLNFFYKAETINPKLLFLPLVAHAGFWLVRRSVTGPFVAPLAPFNAQRLLLVRRRVPGMQRRVTGPFVAFLAPFNAQKLFAGASKGPRHATKGHGTLRCVPGTLQCLKAFCWCVEGSQACNEGSRDPSLRSWHPSMHKGFWLVRRRVPGMQRRVTGPFVAPLAPFNAQRLFAGASKGPRHATKGHGTLRCAPSTLQCTEAFCWCVEGSQACNEGSRDPSLRSWHPSMHKGFGWCVEGSQACNEGSRDTDLPIPTKPSALCSSWVIPLSVVLISSSQRVSSWN